jgi:hypothetical protein
MAYRLCTYYGNYEDFMYPKKEAADDYEPMTINHFVETWYIDRAWVADNYKVFDIFI